VADDARPAGALLPTDASPAQQALNRRLLSQAQGKGPVFIGERFRIWEGPYPTPADAVCLHVQVLTSSGWRSVFVVAPDGTFGGIP
jgi:hypothetical protein